MFGREPISGPDVHQGFQGSRFPIHHSLECGQQLAGLVMALEQSIVMGIVLAILFGKMLVESEREARREERYGEA